MKVGVFHLAILGMLLENGLLELGKERTKQDHMTTLWEILQNRHLAVDRLDLQVL